MKIFLFVLTLLNFLISNSNVNHLHGGMKESIVIVFLKGWIDWLSINPFLVWVEISRWDIWLGLALTMLLLSCGDQYNMYRRPLRFLYFWIDKDDFKEIIKNSWILVKKSDIFSSLKQKIKNTKTTLVK